MGVTCNTCIFSCSFFDTFDFLFRVFNHKKMAIVFFSPPNILYQSVSLSYTIRKTVASSYMHISIARTNATGKRTIHSFLMLVSFAYLVIYIYSRNFFSVHMARASDRAFHIQRFEYVIYDATI